MDSTLYVARCTFRGWRFAVRLPVTLTCLKTEGPVTWEFMPVLDAAHRAALGSAKPLIYVCPPAAWAVRPLFQALTPAEATPATLVAVPEVSHALDLAAALQSLASLGPIHPITAPTRAQSLLRAGGVRTLIGTLPDILDLVRRSAFKPENLVRVVVGWPEYILSQGLSESLDTLLADAPEVQRLIVTEDEGAMAEFLERHARRAPVAAAARLPAAAAGPARYAVVDQARRAHGGRLVLDALDPRSGWIWDPSPDAAARCAALTAQPGVRLLNAGAGDGAADLAELAIALDLPSARVLDTLRAGAREVVVLLDGVQLPYLERIASPVTPLRLAGASDQARDALARLRRDLRERLAGGTPVTELLALDPLFEEYDPALVAAALLAARGAPGPVTSEQVPTWVRLHVNAGRRDQLRPGDLVGALLHGVGLSKDQVGRIDLREGFALVDVRASEAERAVAGLNGATIRGRRIAARIDRR
jgi:hypothetical protein